MRILNALDLACIYVTLHLVAYQAAFWGGPKQLWGLTYTLEAMHLVTLTVNALALRLDQKESKAEKDATNDILQTTAKIVAVATSTTTATTPTFVASAQIDSAGGPENTRVTSPAPKLEEGELFGKGLGNDSTVERRDNGDDGNLLQQTKSFSVPNGSVYSNTAVQQHTDSLLVRLLGMVDLLPLDVFCLVVPAGAARWRLLALLRLNRLLRSAVLIRALNRWEHELGSRLLYVHVVKISLYVPLLIQIVACTWAALVYQPNSLAGPIGSLPSPSSANNLSPPSITTSSPPPNDWLASRSSIDSPTNDIDVYIWALYWSFATITSTGYGDIHAMIAAEQWFASVGMLLGVVAFGYLLGSLTSTLTNQEALHARVEQGYQALERHMRIENIPLHLQTRALTYLQHLWARHHGRTNDDMFGDIPRTLQADVMTATVGDMIARVPSLSDADPSLLRMVAFTLHPTLVLAGEEIIRFGDLTPAMYFIVSGNVHVLDRCGTIYHTIEPGGHFGEAGLILGLRSTVCLKAASSCELYMLRKQDFERVLESFPRHRALIFANISRRVESAAKEHDVSSSKESHPHTHTRTHTHTHTRAHTYTQL